MTFSTHETTWHYRNIQAFVSKSFMKSSTHAKHFQASYEHHMPRFPVDFQLEWPITTSYSGSRITITWCPKMFESQPNPCIMQHFQHHRDLQLRALKICWKAQISSGQPYQQQLTMISQTAAIMKKLMIFRPVVRWKVSMIIERIPDTIRSIPSISRCWNRQNLCRRSVAVWRKPSQPAWPK